MFPGVGEFARSKVGFLAVKKTTCAKYLTQLLALK